MTSEKHLVAKVLPVRVRWRIPTVNAIAAHPLLLKAVIVPEGTTDDGLLIASVALPWFKIVERLQRDPDFAHQIDWRVWEEIIAGAYTEAGFDEVTLTPRSNDKGRDVIAVKRGVGSVRFMEQVKAYSPGNLVTHDEVLTMAGVLNVEPNVSKGLITTTSDFAPGVYKDDNIKRLMPYRLELKPKDKLIKWLSSLKG